MNQLGVLGHILYFYLFIWSYLIIFRSLLFANSSFLPFIFYHKFWLDTSPVFLQYLSHLKNIFRTALYIWWISKERGYDQAFSRSFKSKNRSFQYNAAWATTGGIRLIQRKALQELDLEFLQQKSFLKIFDNGSPNYPTFIISTIILYHSNSSYHTITPSTNDLTIQDTANVF